MAIIRYSSFDKTVNTIAERNALTNKVNHMTVLVKDAIADVDVGSGKATYRWDASDDTWILVSKSKTDTISFETEEITITNGTVVPSNIILDNQIWNIQIIQNDLIFTEPRISDLIIDYTGISGLNDYNGMKLKFTYAFGNVNTMLSSVISDFETRLDNIVVNSDVNLVEVSTDIIPINNSILNIGSATNRFKSIYVDEAYLSTNTLYIGDTPVLGTNQDTILIKADPDQSINMKTFGTGSTIIESAHEVSITTSGVNSDVKVQATGVNSKVRFSGSGGIEFSSAVSAQSDLSVSGNLTVTGNVTANGNQFLVNSTTVTTKDNIITLNQGEVGSGVTSGKSGIQIDRGDAADYQLIFDEVSDKFVVGQVGGTFETLATREYVGTTIGTLAEFTTALS